MGVVIVLDSLSPIIGCETFFFLGIANQASKFTMTAVEMPTSLSCRPRHFPR
jgi:hypothetical protein